MPEDLGKEIEAPSGYYQPVEEALLEHEGRQVLCVAGCACIETSCCGVGRWSYVRVEGYVAEDTCPSPLQDRSPLAVDTVENENDRAALRGLLLARYPGARIEFR